MALYLTSLSNDNFKIIEQPGFILALDDHSPFMPHIKELPGGAYKLTDGDGSYIRFNIIDGRIDGEYEHYDRHLGDFCEKGHYIQGEREGVWVSQDYGQYYSIYHYSGGLLNGTALNYHKGRLSSSITYKRGVYHGPYKRYHTTGKIAYKANYVNNKLHGYGHYYDEGGRLFKKELYKNDRILWAHNLSPAREKKLTYKM